MLGILQKGCKLKRIEEQEVEANNIQAQRSHIIHSRLMAKNEKVFAACGMSFSLILLYLSTLLNSINLSCVGMYSVANQSVACYGLKCEKSSNGANPPLMTHFTRADI